MTHRWVDTQSGLEDLVDALAGVDRYAIDTEFHRERTYFPKLALVQLAWDTPDGQDVALVDPLAVDVKALGRLFAGPAVAVFHAAQQDLDVLTHACGCVPGVLFDTQLAAGFIGYSTPSLVALVQGELGASLPKGDRLTDWLRRPLTADQEQYAASDVIHLFALHDKLSARLDQLGRQSWVQEACEELRQRPASGVSPDEAWTRLKDVRTLKPRARSVARSVAAWRERRAMSVDAPPRQILPDLAILGISQRQPRDQKELAQCRGVDERHWRGALGREILAAVADGASSEAALPASEGEDLDRHLRPAVTLVSAWVAEVARTQRIDTALLATRADLVSLLRGDDDARLGQGWRAELLGDGIRRLVEGRAGLTFDGRGGLRLIDVEGPPPRSN